MISTHTPPPVFARSRTKLWIRTGILVVFGTLFSLALYPHLRAGVLSWRLALALFVDCLAIGFFGLSRLVPMRAHASGYVTLHFDRIYFPTIFLLVVAKTVAAHVPGLGLWPDLIMCTILGLMIGRLSGVCLRVRALRRTLAPAA